MALFLYEAVDSKLNKKNTVIPKNLHNLALKVKAEYGNNTTQDGYKTVNRLLDGSYNKKNQKDTGISAKQDTAPKLDKNDNLVKFPTSAARKMIGDLEKEKNFIDPQAKETFVNYLKTDVKQKESSVKSNNLVPQVPKTAKPVDAKKAAQPKQVTTANPSIKAENKTKKIILPEAKLLILKEDYRQLNIPFHHDTENYDFKENWESYLDFLEKIGRYGKLKPSGISHKDLCYRIIEPCFKKNYEEWLKTQDDMEYSEAAQILCSFINDYRIENVMKPNIYNALLDYIEKNNIKGNSTQYFNSDHIHSYSFYIDALDRVFSIEVLIDFCSNVAYINLDLFDLANDLFKNDKIKLFNDHSFNFYEKVFNEYGMMDNLILNDNGLIYIERALTMPNKMDRKKIFNNKSYFEKLTGSFSGVGNCWTWSKGASEAYNGTGYKNGSEIILKGWVDPKNVDWNTTILRNTYDLREEKEIFLANGTEIELDQVLLDDINILKNPIIVPA